MMVMDDEGWKASDEGELVKCEIGAVELKMPDEVRCGRRIVKYFHTLELTIGPARKC